MKYLELIRANLKNTTLVDLFETYDVNVIYDYDCTYENQPDRYHTEIPDLGLNFTFDENQSFSALHITPVESTTFNPFEPDDERLKGFTSKSKAIKYAKKKNVTFVEGAAEFMGENKDWIRFNYNNYSLHYEFVKSELKLITIIAKDK
jgi:hypothetical protein